MSQEKISQETHDFIAFCEKCEPEKRNVDVVKCTTCSFYVCEHFVARRILHTPFVFCKACVNRTTESN